MQETSDRNVPHPARADACEATHDDGSRVPASQNEVAGKEGSGISESEGRIAALEKRLAALENHSRNALQEGRAKPLAVTLNGVAVLFALASAGFWHLSTVGAGTPALAALHTSENELAALTAGISAFLAVIGLFRR